MLIRPAIKDDASAIWSIIGPTIRAGETYALARDMSEADALGLLDGIRPRDLRRHVARFAELDVKAAREALRPSCGHR